MPHIVFDKFNKELVTPLKKEDVSFDFIAKSYNFTEKIRKIEYKVCVEKENKKFLLTLKDKEGNHLLKADKVTRVTPVQLVKDALNDYANEVEANIIFFKYSRF